MIDINQIINREIKKAYMLGRHDLAEEILGIIKCPKSPTEYIENVAQATDRMFQVEEEYYRFLRGE